MLESLRKYRKQLKAALAVLLAGASCALVWFTIDAPQPGRSPLAMQMEKSSALYFDTERDIATLVRDARSGAAASIGLSTNYALVNRDDGSRYYVRIARQRTLASELFRDQAPGSAMAVFALSDVKAPASPVASFARGFDPA